MMWKKVKRFYKEKELEIKATVCCLVLVGTGVALGYVLTKSIYARQYLNVKGRNAISWVPIDTDFLTLGEAKELMDLNISNKSMYAIFREGQDSGKYVGITLNNTDVIRPVKPS